MLFQGAAVFQKPLFSLAVPTELALLERVKTFTAARCLQVIAGD